MFEHFSSMDKSNFLKYNSIDKIGFFEYNHTVNLTEIRSYSSNDTNMMAAWGMIRIIMA